jgi:hypothetical protein
MGIYHIFKDANDDVFVQWSDMCYTTEYGDILPNEIPAKNKYPVERIGTGSTSNPIGLEELAMRLKEIMY